MTALVGCTGFVGSNICISAGKDIQKKYHSKNITDAYGTAPDLLIYAGLRAEKYLANHAPEKDLELIMQAEENIAKIKPKRLVLISTIDVFRTPNGVNEKSEIVTEGLHAYGLHRYQLELWVRDRYPDALIIRLPGLFGQNMKKNFIYDFIHEIPGVLNQEKFAELVIQDSQLEEYYKLQESGFYKVDVADKDKEHLNDRFRKLGISALHFTDSRSVYQFYNLAYLWRDMQTALDAGIVLWHAATEPIAAGELYEYLTGEKFVNLLNGMPANYNYRTIYDELWNGMNGYISDKEKALSDIAAFVKISRKGG